MLRKIFAPTKSRLVVFVVFVALFALFANRYSCETVISDYGYYHYFFCKAGAAVLFPLGAAANLLHFNPLQQPYFISYALSLFFGYGTLLYQAADSGIILLIFLIEYYVLTCLLVAGWEKYSKPDPYRKKIAGAAIIMGIFLTVSGALVYELYSTGAYVKSNVAVSDKYRAVGVSAEDCINVTTVYKESACSVTEETEALLGRLNKALADRNTISVGISIANRDTGSEYGLLTESSLEFKSLVSASMRSVKMAKNITNITANTTLDELYGKKEVRAYLGCLEKAMNSCWLNIEENANPGEWNNKKAQVTDEVGLFGARFYLTDDFFSFGGGLRSGFKEEIEKGRYWRALVKANEVLYAGKIIEDAFDLPEKICSEKLNSTEC